MRARWNEASAHQAFPMRCELRYYLQTQRALKVPLQARIQAVIAALSVWRPLAWLSQALRGARAEPTSGVSAHPVAMHCLFGGLLRSDKETVISLSVSTSVARLSDRQCGQGVGEGADLRPERI